MLFKNLFNRVPAFRKSAAIYISDKLSDLIIAPYHINKAGIYYEQPICTKLHYPIDPETLGAEAIRNFNLFSLKDRNLRDAKQSDWPAYKHGNCKTIKAFEQNYAAIFIKGNNQSNIILSIEAPFRSDANLNIKASLSVKATHRQIGEQIITVYQKALSN